GGLGGKPYALEVGLLLEDGDASLEVRWLDIGDQAPFEARAEALLDVGDLFRRGIRGEDDLAMTLVQVVERVEELLLGAFLAGDEVDVVDQEEIDVAVLGAEFCGSVVTDGVDQLVGEALGGEVEKPLCWIQAGKMGADRKQGEGLGETPPALE